MSEIRYITESDDRKAISRIYEESWKYAYSGIIPQEYLESIPEGRWADRLDTPGWNTMVCIDEGIFIGTSSFCKSRFDSYPDSGEIISIYFLPDYMKKGFGSKLLAAVLDRLKEQGYDDVFLWVLEENTQARRFYEKNGFSCTDDYREDVISGKALREVRYVYQIAHSENMAIEYRTAAKEDAEVLVNIYNASFYDDYLRFGSCPGYGNTKEMMEESILQHPKYIILCDDEPVGCVSYTKLGMGEYEVSCLCIVPDFQGKGIGTHAIRFLKTFLEDWKRLTLVTPIDKKENVRFYTEKCGFHIESMERDGDVELARFVAEK